MGASRYKNINNIPTYSGIGVYKIFNPTSGRVYVGSALNCMERLKQHNRQLPNIEMENDRPEGGYECEILERFEQGCYNYELADAEEKYFEEYKKLKPGVYNSPEHQPIHNYRREKKHDFVYRNGHVTVRNGGDTTAWDALAPNGNTADRDDGGETLQ